MPHTHDCSSPAVFGVDIRPIEVEHLSLVRYVHATAMRRQGSHYLGEDEIELFCDAVHSANYTNQLMEQDLIAAWVGGELVGTAGWQPGEDGVTARIGSVFVRPPFTRLGIGERLMQQIETRARRGGFTLFSLRATGNSVSFFERLGYAVTSRGLRNLAVERGVPITFMRKAASSTHIPASAGAQTPISVGG